MPSLWKRPSRRTSVVMKHSFIYSKVFFLYYSVGSRSEGHVHSLPPSKLWQPLLSCEFHYSALPVLFVHCVFNSYKALVDVSSHPSISL